MSFDLSTAKPVGFDLSTAKPADAAGPTGEQKTQASIGGRILQGMRDPIDASAQLLTHMLPAGVVKAGNAANNWLADKTGLVGRLPEGGIDQELADQEKKYQASRAATGNKGIDVARIAGNVASPVNLAIASKVPTAVTMAGKLGTAAGAGALYGATSAPVTEGDFATEKAKQIGLGVAAGPVAELVGAGASRVIKPQTSQEVKTLMSQGITPTPGQIMGGRGQVLEDKLSSLPIVGDAISMSRKRGLDEFNRAVYAKALAPIGGEVPKTVGREAVSQVRQTISNAYETLLPNIHFAVDAKFGHDIQQLRQMATILPESQAKQFEKILQTSVIGKMTDDGLMNGATLKEVESELGRIASGYAKDPSFDNRQLGNALQEVQASIRRGLVRMNPDKAKELQSANEAWANYTKLRDAASRTGAKDGIFTPAQFGAAVRAGDKTVGKRAYSEGDALGQELSDAGQKVLSPKYPDSGTAGRILAGGGAAYVAHALEPSILTGSGLASLPYLPIGRDVAAALMTRRPDVAQPVADRVRKLAPAMTPALIHLLKPSAMQSQN